MYIGEEQEVHTQHVNNTPLPYKRMLPEVFIMHGTKYAFRFCILGKGVINKPTTKVHNLDILYGIKGHMKIIQSRST